jgi:hypothetical protein
MASSSILVWGMFVWDCIDIGHFTLRIGEGNNNLRKMLRKHGSGKNISKN